jgi:hypothetical protein
VGTNEAATKRSNENQHICTEGEYAASKKEQKRRKRHRRASERIGSKKAEGNQGKEIYTIYTTTIAMSDKMHTVWVRLNAVVFFGLTVLLGLSTLAAVSKFYHGGRPGACVFCRFCCWLRLLPSIVGWFVCLSLGVCVFVFCVCVCVRASVCFWGDGVVLHVRSFVLFDRSVVSASLLPVGRSVLPASLLLQHSLLRRCVCVRACACVRDQHGRRRHFDQLLQQQPEPACQVSLLPPPPR